VCPIPDPAWGAYSAPPDLGGIEGPTSKGRIVRKELEEKERKARRGGERRGEGQAQIQL